MNRVYIFAADDPKTIKNYNNPKKYLLKYAKEKHDNSVLDAQGVYFGPTYDVHLKNTPAGLRNYFNEHPDQSVVLISKSNDMLTDHSDDTETLIKKIKSSVRNCEIIVIVESLDATSYDDNWLYWKYTSAEYLKKFGIKHSFLHWLEKNL